MVRDVNRAIVIALLCLFAPNCNDKDEPIVRAQESARETVKQKTIEEVLAEHTPEWMAVPGVIGTGIGECDRKPCIKVLVVEASDSLSQRIPKEVEGFPVRIEVTGEIKAH